MSKNRGLNHHSYSLLLPLTKNNQHTKIFSPCATRAEKIIKNQQTHPPDQRDQLNNKRETKREQQTNNLNRASERRFLQSRLVNPNIVENKPPINDDGFPIGVAHPAGFSRRRVHGGAFQRPPHGGRGGCRGTRWPRAGGRCPGAGRGADDGVGQLAAAAGQGPRARVYWLRGPQEEHGAVQPARQVVLQLPPPPEGQPLQEGLHQGLQVCSKQSLMPMMISCVSDLRVSYGIIVD